MAEPIQPTEPESPVEPTAPERVEPVETSPTEQAETAVLDPTLVETPAPKKRRRWIGWLIGLAVLVVLLIVGFIVADSFARQYARDLVREQIIQVLGLPADTAIDVGLGEGSLILQALRGSIDEVTVGIDSFTVGPITGSAQLVATAVPLDSAQPLDTLGITITIPESEVRNLAGNFSGLELESIDLGDGLITIGTEVSILSFITIPLSIDLEPTAIEGGISFDPKVIRAGEDEISVADLRSNALFSSIAGDLLNAQDFCVADSVPQALTIDEAAVVGSSLVVRLNGNGAALGGPAMSTFGTCPAP
jgi:hypothetical protein